jgi:glycosyltransferase involved in cell wall biosynthesis
VTRLLFLVRRAGPYHNARYEAAGSAIDLTVVETRPDSAEYPWSTLAGARNYSLHRFEGVVDPELGLRGRSLDQALRKCFQSAKPDVVACTGWADPEYHAALRRCHSEGIPAIVMSDSTLDDEPRRWWRERLKSPIVSGFSAAVVAGIRSRAYMCGLGFPRSAIFAPCDVVDNAHFSRLAAGGAHGEGSAVPYFLCVSRLLPKKNLFLLVEAYAAYRLLHGAQAWDLVILGSGEMESQLLASISRTGVTAHVRLPGFVQYGELPAYYSGAGACVLASLSDQWGLAVNEAMAAGLPVIVSRGCGCAPDLIMEGENGHTFDPRDGATLTRLMYHVANATSETRAAMGEASRSRIESYTPERFAGALVEAAAYARSKRTAPGIVTRVALQASAYNG